MRDSILFPHLQRWRSRRPSHLLPSFHCLLPQITYIMRYSDWKVPYRCDFEGPLSSFCFELLLPRFPFFFFPFHCLLKVFQLLWFGPFCFRVSGVRLAEGCWTEVWERERMEVFNREENEWGGCLKWRVFWVLNGALCVGGEAAASVREVLRGLRTRQGAVTGPWAPVTGAWQTCVIKQVDSLVCRNDLSTLFNLFDYKDCL